MSFNIKDQYKKEIVITESMITGFAKVTGDHNPVHLDVEFAKKTIFKKRIAHGMLIGSLISAILGNEFPGLGTIYFSQTMKFINPVFINDKISFHFEVIEIQRNNWIKIKTECYNQENKIILKGEAIVNPPDNSDFINSCIV